MIEFEGVKLLPIEYEDVVLLNKWKNDKEVFKYLGGGYRPTSLSQQKNWMDKFIDNTMENQRYIIVDEENEKVGQIGLYQISNIHRTCSLGIYIGVKEKQGRGIASKAYKALEKYAKSYLNIRKIHLEVVGENERAIHMYEKLGFYVCGKYQKERYIDGKYIDLIIMDKFIGENN